MYFYIDMAASTMYVNDIHPHLSNRSSIPLPDIGILSTISSHSLGILSTLSSHSLGILATCFLAVLVKLLWTEHISATKDHSCHLPLPPGTYGLPVIGETFSLIMKGVDFHKEKQIAYGNVFKTHILGRPTIRVTGAENVRKILTNENHYVTSQWPKSVRSILGTGTLSMATGNVHRTRRRQVMKAFNHKALSGYVPSIRSMVQRYLVTWSECDVILAYPELKRLMFAVACRTLLGFDMDPNQEGKMLTIFETITRNIFSLPIYLPGTGFYKGMKARHALLRQIETCIDRRRKQPDFDGRNDALSIVMRHAEVKDEMTDTELKDICLELLFAGHETLSSTACSVLRYLGQNPKVVHRAFAELTEHGLDPAFSVDDGESELTYESIAKLRYIDNIVKEVLRLAPPIGGAFRQALQTFEVAGHQIPKGWSVNYSIRDTQLCSDSFGETDIFDPDRWNDVNERDLKRHFDFIPFGGGSRTCAGREFAKLVLKVFIVELIQKFTVKLINDNPEMTYFPIPRPKDNLPVRIREASAFRRRAFTV